MTAEHHDDDNDGVRNMETINSEMSTQVEGYLVNWNLIWGGQRRSDNSMLSTDALTIEAIVRRNAYE